MPEPTRIVIETLGDGYSTDTFYTRGHVDVDAFLQAVAGYCYDEEDEGQLGAVGDVRHAWMRWRRPSRDEADDIGLYAVLRSGPERGAFPVNLIDRDDLEPAELCEACARWVLDGDGGWIDSATGYAWQCGTCAKAEAGVRAQ